LSEFVADCRERQRQLLWARHDKRTRRWASEMVRQVWHTMGYMSGGGLTERVKLPQPPTDPEQLMRLRPEQATGEAIRAFAVAVAWAEERARGQAGEGTDSRH
jgi:hypothetical protein